MKKHLSLLLFLSFVIPAAAGEYTETLTLRKIPALNLLVNPDFSRLEQNESPHGWSFDNCSRSEKFHPHVISDKSGNILAVDSGWSIFGYWLQSVPVKEGHTYYVAAQFQSNGPNAMMWLRCREYDDGGSPLGHYPPSQTQFYVRSYLHQGLELKQVLDDFVEPELVAGVSAEIWTCYDLEFTVPTGKGAKNYDVRLGVYGGNPGQVRFRRPVFREAASQLKAEVSGQGWTYLRVQGANPECIRLNPDFASQQAVFTLPSSNRRYRVELTHRDGRKIEKEFNHE